jgi:hypothetical protein
MLLRVLPLAIALAQIVPPTAQPRLLTQAPSQTYNEAADAKAAIAVAVKRAAADGIRVLINWGANDNGACAKFVEMLRSRAVDPKFFLLEYRPVYVNVGRADRNQDLARSYGVTIAADSLPALTVLDDAGKVVANATARDFAGAAEPSAALFSAFLAKHQAPAPNANVQLEDALKQAKRDGKLAFVWFSAPW